MELSTTRKKKRRTRKCLDEIRKRSRPMRSDYLEQTSQHHEKINRVEQGHTHRLITMNRLTLNMFPKTIRSEIATRPLLEDIKQKASYNNIFQDKSTKLSCISSLKDPEAECFEHCNSAASTNSVPMFDLEEDSRQEHVSSHSDIPLRNYPNSHGPTHGMAYTQNPEALIYSTTTATSLSSQTSDGDHREELYEEIMIKISSHLKKVTSAIINQDVLKNTKVHLQNLYKMSWSKEYKISMADHEQSDRSTTTTSQSPKHSMIQNPLDFIRLKQVQHRGMHYDCHSDLVPEEPFSTAPVPAAEALYSPHRSQTFGTESHQIPLYDTPEYNYYPHRLN